VSKTITTLTKKILTLSLGLKEIVTTLRASLLIWLAPYYRNLFCANITCKPIINYS